MTNKSLSEEENYYYALAYQILIRSCLLFGKDDLSINLKRKLANITADSSIIQMLNESINMYESDKSIPNIVELRL